MQTTKNYYTILGISPECNEGEIKTAFRQLAKQCHPDMVSKEANNSLEASLLVERFKEINEAHETLIQPGKRKSYDQSLKRKGKQSPKNQSKTPDKSAKKQAGSPTEGRKRSRSSSRQHHSSKTSSSSRSKTKEHYHKSRVRHHHNPTGKQPSFAAYQQNQKRSNILLALLMLTAVIFFVIILNPFSKMHSFNFTRPEMLPSARYYTGNQKQDFSDIYEQSFAIPKEEQAHNNAFTSPGEAEPETFLSEEPEERTSFDSLSDQIWENFDN